MTEEKAFESKSLIITASIEDGKIYATITHRLHDAEVAFEADFEDADEFEIIYTQDYDLIVDKIVAETAEWFHSLEEIKGMSGVWDYFTTKD